MLINSEMENLKRAKTPSLMTERNQGNRKTQKVIKKSPNFTKILHENIERYRVKSGI
jgi:hypothetical protein